MKKWKPMRTSPKTGEVQLLGTIDTSREGYENIKGVWNNDIEMYVTKSGWCIVAVAWRECK